MILIIKLLELRDKFIKAEFNWMIILKFFIRLVICFLSSLINMPYVIDLNKFY